jgi:hypothetical protein
VLGIDEYRRAFDQAAEANKKLEREEKKRDQGRPVGARATSLAQLSLQAGAAFAAFELVASGLERAGQTLANLVLPSVEAFSRQQDSLIQMEILFRNLGRATDIAPLSQFNRDLQETSGQTTAALAGLTAMLARFKFTRAEIERTTPVLLDFAAATGIELTRATDIVAAALRGEKDALQTFGVDLTVTGNRARDLNEILRQLEERYRGGVAVAIRTQSGALRDLSNSFEELKASSGRALEPFVVNLANAAAEVNRAISDFVNFNLGLLESLGLRAPATAAARNLGGGSRAQPATEDTAKQIAANTAKQTGAIEALLRSGGGPLARGALNIRGLNAALRSAR